MVFSLRKMKGRTKLCRTKAKCTVSVKATAIQPKHITLPCASLLYHILHDISTKKLCWIHTVLMFFTLHPPNRDIQNRL